MKKESKGITLVTLVITIIILLILAGITISALTGDNGLLARAKQSKKVMENVQKEENEILENYIQQTEKYLPKEVPQVKNNIDKILSTTSNTELQDENGNKIIVPAGFKIIANEDTSNAVTVDKGIVIEDATSGTNKGNQFVWVPVKNISEYKRKAMSVNISSNEIDKKTNSEKIYQDSNEEYYYIEQLPEDEKNSIEIHKGFYISRYEAGDLESTKNKKYREKGTGVENTVVSQKNSVPYNYVRINEAKKLAEEMYKSNNFQTKLCSSYAWDTTIDFIEKVLPQYSSSATDGNYKDSTFEYLDIDGIRKIKNTNMLIPTGQTNATNNIFDMGGNCWEWTLEKCSKEDQSYVVRGCGYRWDLGAGYRSYDNDMISVEHATFRITMFLKTKN